MKNFFNVLDIETFTFENKVYPYCVCLLYKSEMIKFYGEQAVSELFLFFEKNSVRATIYVHNLSFDGGILLNEVKKNDYVFKGLFLKNSIYNLIIKGKNPKKKFKIFFKCSYKLLPLSLEKLAPLLGNGLTKESFPHEWVSKDRLFYRGFHPTNLDNKNWDLKNAVLEYCANDVKILHSALQLVARELETAKQGFPFRLVPVSRETIPGMLEKINSISALSFYIYRTYFNNCNVNLTFEKKTDIAVREAYYGGRCEVFANPHKNEQIHHFDFSGMYAQVMKDSFSYGKIIKTFPSHIDKPGFYLVKVNSAFNYLPLLPYRDPIDKKLLFPNGSWVGLYWWEEVLFFQKNGGVVEQIYYALEFEKEDKIFEEFISFFQNRRKRDDFSNFFWKIFINSLSGRLGMRPDDTITEVMSYTDYLECINKKIIIEEKISKSEDNEKIVIVTSKKKYIWVSDSVPIDLEKFTNANVALAAAITAKARIKLNCALIQTLNSGGRIYYCDTDSIFAGFTEARYGSTLGEITWDGAIIKEAVFALPKGYALLNKDGTFTVKLKGFTRNTIDFEQFKKIWEKRSYENFKNLHFKKANFQWSFEMIEKKIYLSSYNKRILKEDKSDTKPLKIISS